MTENRCIEVLKKMKHMFTETCAKIDENTALDMAVEAIEEIQQYRAIGTVEEIQKKMEELERWHTDRINENIKNPFAYTSTSICHNCDHKDEYIEELEAENAEYKSIGTIEDFKALKEKNTPKKPYKGRFGVIRCLCCDEKVGQMVTSVLKEDCMNFCAYCGSKVDWSE